MLRRTVLHMLSLDENANLSTEFADSAHPENNSSSAPVDLTHFLEMKEKHDAAKEVKFTLKVVGKSVRTSRF